MANWDNLTDIKTYLQAERKPSTENLYTILITLCARILYLEDNLAANDLQYKLKVKPQINFLDDALNSGDGTYRP